MQRAIIMHVTSIILIAIIQIFFCEFSNSQFTWDESCQLDYGNTGTCVHIDMCPEAINLLQFGRYPKICRFEGLFPIVCCENNVFNPSRLQDLDLKGTESCQLDYGNTGTCVHIDTCPEALDLLEIGGRPKICRYEGMYPIVCCENKVSRLQDLVSISTESCGNSGRCVPMDRCPEAMKFLEYGNLSILCERNGIHSTVCCENYMLRSTEIQESIARIKCDVYKFVKMISSPPYVQSAFAGIDTLPLEFPHMAILGYGTPSNIRWGCGGSLISENFVLTAAHCIKSEMGQVKFVKLGAHRLDYKHEREQMFYVKNVHKHPDYVSTQSYHDVGLIELDHPVEMGFLGGIQPACLHTSKELPNSLLSATGWGAVHLYGGMHNIQQKVFLRKVPVRSCRKYYKRQRMLRKGILDDWQICADGGGTGADTCQGDSGGPLQTKSDDNSLYTIVGITSTGIKCGLVPSVYTRVSHYVPWIESIVWPEEI